MVLTRTARNKLAEGDNGSRGTAPQPAPPPRRRNQRNVAMAAPASTLAEAPIATGQPNSTSDLTAPIAADQVTEPRAGKDRRRGLRSTKTPNSPLQRLPSPTKKAPRIRKDDRQPGIAHHSEDAETQTSDDEGPEDIEGVYFTQLQVDGLKANEEWAFNVWHVNEALCEQVNELVRANAELFQQHQALQDQHQILASRNQTQDNKVKELEMLVQSCRDAIEARNRELQKREKAYNKLKKDNDERRLDQKRLRDRYDEHVILYPQPSRRPMPETPEELLAAVEKNKAEALQNASSVHYGDTSMNEADNDYDPDSEPGDMDLAGVQSQQRTEAAPPQQTSAPENPPPKSSGWGLGLIKRFVPSIFSSPASILGSPATAAPTVLQPHEVTDLAETLAPVDTPSHPSRLVDARNSKNAARHKHKKDKKSKKKSKGTIQQPDRRAIINAVTKDVDADDKMKARSWARKEAEKLARDPVTIGQKRMRIEAPDIRVRDVEQIPARRPWEATGSYGILDEFFYGSDSDSDDAEVPAWYALQHAASPPPKKRKTSHAADAHVNGTPNTLTSSPMIDTDGNSASLHDLHPRPSYVASPMFSSPAMHEPRGNVFQEQQAAHQSATFHDQFQQTAHNPGSGSFTVPDDDDDDTADGEHWSQSPPPPPVPAHASLPVSVATIENPPKPVEGFPKPIDPVEIQRQRALKHTPAKASRLREVMVRSPSLKSDADFSTTMASTMYGAAPHFDIPDPSPIDVEPETLAAAQSVFKSSEYQTMNINAYGGADVVLSYDEEDEDSISDDDLYDDI